MGPGLDDGVKRFPGALGLDALPVPQQLVIPADLARLDAQLYELLGRVDLRVGRLLLVESADERDADAAVVVVVRVGSLDVPAAALVHEAVAPDEEAEAYVVPALRLYVERLGQPHQQYALGLGVAEARRRVAYYHVHGRPYLQWLGRQVRRLRAPFYPLNDPHTRYRWLCNHIKTRVSRCPYSDWSNVWVVLLWKRYLFFLAKIALFDSRLKTTLVCF